MRIFKSKAFAKFARKESISDAMLCEAVRCAEQGKVDADYGGGVIKQRLARPNEGKSGGYRVVIFYLRGDKAFFVHGFAKKDQANISTKDEKNLKESAREMFAFTDEQMNVAIQKRRFEEIKYNA